MTEILEKKKRGRPKKIVDTSVIEEQPKKKRGRPKKFALYKDFSENITNIFSNYLITYKDIIENFINHDDNRINQNDWNIIYEHVKQLSKQIHNDIEFDDYHYKINSQWKSIDNIREQQRKQYITFFYNENIDDNIYKGYMIYCHLKSYISESSKESKI